MRQAEPLLLNLIVPSIYSDGSDGDGEETAMITCSSIDRIILTFDDAVLLRKLHPSPVFLNLTIGTPRMTLSSDALFSELGILFSREGFFTRLEAIVLRGYDHIKTDII